MYSRPSSPVAVNLPVSRFIERPPQGPNQYASAVRLSSPAYCVGRCGTSLAGKTSPTSEWSAPHGFGLAPGGSRGRPVIRPPPGQLLLDGLLEPLGLLAPQVVLAEAVLQ